MEMAVESMEMAPGAIPHPGRVPEQSLLSPEFGLRWQWRCGTFRGRTPIDLGFSRQRDFIGGRAISEGGPGAHTTWWRGQRGARHPMVCLPPGPPTSHLWTPCRVEKNRNFRLCFVQFREYFCVTFLKHKNSRK
jgi:hypothetical protein